MFVRSQAAAVIIYSWAPKRTCFICLCDLKWPYCVGGEWPVASLAALGWWTLSLELVPLFYWHPLIPEGVLKSAFPSPSRTASLSPLPEEAWHGRLFLPLVFHAAWLVGTAAA